MKLQRSEKDGHETVSSGKAARLKRDCQSDSESLNSTSIVFKAATYKTVSAPCPFDPGNLLQQH